ncbi:MAG: hypothetical protein KF872_06075 [Chitinophagales bacterium]|nr:hypothetical protein [Chitinophagales bacterium]
MLLKKADAVSNKKDMVYSVSDGRTESTCDLTFVEANVLIERLKNIVGNKDAELDAKRKRLIAMAFSMGGDVNFAKKWCEKYGTGGTKKKFNEYTSKELSALIAKFQKVKKHTLNKIVTLGND